jgi:hypothetical protein
MSDLRKPLLGLMAALIALFGAIALNTHADSPRSAALTETASSPA